MDTVRNMTDASSTAQKRLATSWKVIKVFLGLLSAVGTALAIFQWYKYIGSDPSVKFNVIDNQCFTKVEAIPNLKSSFTFHGHPIDSLWSSRVLIENDCQKNIIGTPYHDLMSSNISFKVSDGFKILEVQAEKNDFGAIVNSYEDGFSISFDKWHPNQICLLNIYCEGSSEDDSGPCFAENGESFAQGELRIVEYRQFSVPTSLLNHMPPWLSFISAWVGRIIYGLIIIICFWGATINIHWVRLVKRLRWNRKYLSKAKTLLTNLTENDKNSLSIDRMPKDFWNSHGIPAPPRNSQYLKGIEIDYGELKPLLTICIVGFILSFIALAGLICF